MTAPSPAASQGMSAASLHRGLSTWQPCPPALPGLHVLAGGSRHQSSSGCALPPRPRQSPLCQHCSAQEGTSSPHSWGSPPVCSLGSRDARRATCFDPGSLVLGTVSRAEGCGIRYHMGLRLRPQAPWAGPGTARGGCSRHSLGVTRGREPSPEPTRFLCPAPGLADQPALLQPALSRPGSSADQEGSPPHPTSRSLF